MTIASTAIFRMYYSLLSVMKDALNCAMVFELQYGPSFVATRFKEIVDDIMTLWYLPE